MKLAKIEKPVYSVVELETKNVKDFKKLARENITPKIVDANGVPVHISKIRTLQYRKGNTDTVFFKYNNYDDEYNSFVIGRRRRSQQTSLDTYVDASIRVSPINFKSKIPRPGEAL